MPTFIILPTIPPYQQVAVHPAEVLALQPDPQAPATGTDLVAAGGRSIRVLLQVDQVAQRLGQDFIAFDAAAVQAHKVYINRQQVLHVLPHPQQAGVCQVHSKDRIFAVQGTLAAVTQALT